MGLLLFGALRDEVFAEFAVLAVVVVSASADCGDEEEGRDSLSARARGVDRDDRDDEAGLDGDVGEVIGSDLGDVVDFFAVLDVARDSGGVANRRGVARFESSEIPSQGVGGVADGAWVGFDTRETIKLVLVVVVANLDVVGGGFADVRDYDFVGDFFAGSEFSVGTADLSTALEARLRGFEGRVVGEDDRELGGDGLLRQIVGGDVRGVDDDGAVLDDSLNSRLVDKLYGLARGESPDIEVEETVGVGDIDAFGFVRGDRFE